MDREAIEAVLSPYYGALTQTAIDAITDKLIAHQHDTAQARGYVFVKRERWEELEGIERRAIEWRSDTTLTHPSASELAINNAMSYVLDGDGEDTTEEPSYAYGVHCGGEAYVLCDSREEAERLIARAASDLPVRLRRRRVGPWQPVEAGA